MNTLIEVDGHGVILRTIFGYLHPNDLLRLRCVNKGLKFLAENHLSKIANFRGILYIDLPKEFQQPDETENIYKLDALPFKHPVKHVVIQNNCLELVDWNNEKIIQFVTKYSGCVKHLKLRTLQIPIPNLHILRFFESFTALNTLEIDNVELWVDEIPNVFVSSFRKCRRLEFLACYKGNLLLLNDLIERCCSEVTEYIRYPAIQFTTICRLLQTGRLPKLKTLNIKGYSEANLRDFARLIDVCYMKKVKLEMVNARLIDLLLPADQRKLSNVISSLDQLHHNSFYLELPLLERINIWKEFGTMHNVSMQKLSTFRRQNWENLKSIKLFINTTEIRTSYNGIEKIKTTELFNYLFDGIRREKMQELYLKFDTLEEENGVLLPYPKITHIFTSCPCIKILSIKQWPGSNKAISMIWQGLPLLTEVAFTSCYSLSNAAFVGSDINNLSLHAARNLRTLKLKELHEMPQITDCLFRTVLHDMPLEDLYLQSRGKLYRHQLSLDGLSGLKGGVFSRTVRKLTFDFRLQGTSHKQLNLLINILKRVN